MTSKPSHNPLLWIPSLSAAEEIPTAVITFIVLLMFLQFGETMAMSAFYSSLLFLPFVLKSFFRSKIRMAGNFKFFIHIAEACIFFLLVLMEMSINYFPGSNWILFVLSFMIASMCAWHDLLGRMYYDRMLYPRQQKIFNKTKIFASQTTIVLTYGVLIIFVGFLEVIFRMPTEVLTKKLAWAMECYIIAGGFLIFSLINLLVLKQPNIQSAYHHESVSQTIHKEMAIIERIRQKDNSFHILLSLFFLLLPQALMFYTRVFFLLGREEDGGLDCSVPDVGFAQGTIGVIAFATGLMLGRHFISKYGSHRMFWFMVLPLTLSPTFYMLMANNPLVGNMLAICCMCMLAQLCFGFGLNVCISYVRYVSGERYRNTIDYLYIPLISAAMIIPMMLSGWLCQTLGFRTFFILDASSALIAWIFIFAFGIRNKLEINGKEK